MPIQQQKFASLCKSHNALKQELAKMDEQRQQCQNGLNKLLKLQELLQKMLGIATNATRPSVRRKRSTTVASLTPVLPPREGGWSR